MTNVRTMILIALCVPMIGNGDDGKAEPPQLLNPKAAEQYASDSEKAARGDPEAAYRMGEAFESGRLGGLKDLDKALTFYRLAAQKGHQLAAARVAQIEGERGQSLKKLPPPAPLGH